MDSRDSSTLSVWRRTPLSTNSMVLRFGTVNIHLTKNKKKKRREFIGVIEHWIRIDICGVVETWFKDNGRMLEDDLKNSEYQWFGKDRKRRHGGGVGFLVRKNLQAKVINSNSENLMWITVQSNIYVVFLMIKQV